MTAAIPILWTGGWDSTYRVLDLVLHQGRAVQPLYVRDHNRRSAAREIETMAAIRKAAITQKSEAGRLLPPTQVYDRAAIAADAQITAAYRRLASLERLGLQYEWLARLRGQIGQQIELGIHHDDRVQRFRSHQGGGDYQLVFGGFDLPLLGRTKLAMAEDAEAKGFADLMEMTWFCHRGGAAPCGYCAPCRFAIEEGLGRRIPWQGHLRYRVTEPLRRLRSRLQGR